MIGHLGSRVSALLDGQLPPAEAERAWAHVHGCHACRDLVEREGWVKTRLSGLPHLPQAAGAPAHLKDSLRTAGPVPSPFFDPPPIAGPDPARPRRAATVLLGGSAAGVAVLGVLALGLGSGGTPGPERRAPVTDVGATTPGGPAPAEVPRQVLHRTTPGPTR